MNFFKRFFKTESNNISEKADVSVLPVCGATDRGRVRSGNEDYFDIIPENKLFIVADGMGGHNAGEIASMKAVHYVREYFNEEHLSAMKGNPAKIEQEMIRCVEETHLHVITAAKNNPGHRGMGCTIVAALIDGNQLHLCHVGDARAYLGDAEKIRVLTRDHSVVMSLVDSGRMSEEEARFSPMKNELYQAIGGPGKMVPEYGMHPLKKGDRILLCSDGLWDMLLDEEIYNILMRDAPLQEVCEELIEQANEAGGKDNITVAVVLAGRFINS